MARSDDTFNDRMVRKTVIPVIYLWMLAAGSVVAMGIYQPEVVLANLDGFIALIAIIGGTAAPALSTLMRMWESEQTSETAEMPLQAVHNRERDTAEHVHQMTMEKELKVPWGEEPSIMVLQRAVDAEEKIGDEDSE
jgi:ABC-type protease/lipase transport system fused ATPase/permease subunit